MRRFEQEARATAALNHPNILAVFDIGSQDSAPYIVSELLEGETLRARLVGGPLPVVSRYNVVFTPDGKYYAYAYINLLSELYLVERLR